MPRRDSAVAAGESNRQGRQLRSGDRQIEPTAIFEPTRAAGDFCHAVRPLRSAGGACVVFENVPTWPRFPSAASGGNALAVFVP